MEIRYATNPTDFKKYDGERIRNDFLVENLFVQGELYMVYSHYDRLITGGAVPTDQPLKLEDKETLKTEYFLKRREVGFINISENAGKVTVDGESYELNKRDCLYVGKGNKEVSVESVDASNPARFYIVSALAHTNYPTKKLAIEEATPAHLGSDAESNRRTIYKYIHGDGIQSCQLMMGMTFLAPNNMWNTMPPHVHDRRMEAYLYFDMDEESRVFHFMGKPDDTRHIVVKNEQVVLSPPWSIHSGVGTNNYTFIWAMAGENYTFDDMDHVKMEELK
ncbi:5-dehydro-4-deoxy-D-glucuronate isomerase [Bacillus swezeyi]|uniref:4-deoxy-L-threo-5-hexosulose-uronate ketol-isomerase n=1 Tax=Bacillus swezeyi TaxID=1925020 RepID=A0A1R1RM73_9BACI|nr:5-dehydro-4-deoxy-D-glucuronate isomerase [Bacillus swezeyi]MEC1262975.1 5-dehydro-4-deoxy-D-glucuronate isomerase [Bacillus swezeyi]MED1742261.1 5-dehydro-4-deoxy-D-glucuronate isomerase [Bacillus swezeyi]MED2929994.1 5-dehydro-4-deoxy-D-glucuronate isomerase [Bacillus swezeyi]MED2944945.1 5-dehydro-4-deoxy-D-glucuronate isomerase [Bacillus swezeyi]MED2963115.1 5-dehydro-4-deoxy-D-glucuronate isomerase [Bacillus swezeyi]